MELLELYCSDHLPNYWHESGRWVKYEEDVEEGGEMSKPHVATLYNHSLYELRKMLLKDSMLLNVSATNLEEISEIVLDDMVNTHRLPTEKRSGVKAAILKRHCHQHEKHRRVSEIGDDMKFDDIRSKYMERGFHSVEEDSGCANMKSINKLSLVRSLSDFGKIHSNGDSKFAHDVLQNIKNGTTINDSETTQHPMKKSTTVMGIHNELEDSDAYLPKGTCIKMNKHLMDKLPAASEALNVLVGGLDTLDAPISCFVRLQEPMFLGDMTEVPIPTRFIFLLLGPSGEDKENIARYHEIGRAVATIMTDDIFHDIAYKATKREHLLDGFDEFMDAVMVLPPGEWDPATKIEPPAHVPSQDIRKQAGKPANPTDDEKQAKEQEEKAKELEDCGLVRTGRLFGGLTNDIKRKKPFYFSDFKDGLDLKVIAPIIFLYIACLTNYVAFGGLLGDATGNNIGAIESLVGAFVVGVGYGLFSGQPLSILGATGPVLVFETIVFDIANWVELEYLPFRTCVGLWMAIVLLVLVATDVSAIVAYITRFTEENFATLIAVIFIVKAFKKITNIGQIYPVHRSACYCIPSNMSDISTYRNMENSNFTLLPSADDEMKKNSFPCSINLNPGYVNASTAVEIERNLTIDGFTSVGCHYTPNVFLMSLLLFFGTFIIAHTLKKAKTSNFFPTRIKNVVTDFAVIIAIITMTAIDWAVEIETPKLDVPDAFQPTSGRASWLVHPLGESNPIWSVFLALLPALLGSILVFMDQHITAVIVNRKENQLKKGCGYHLDLFVVAVLIAVCSMFGLPWCEAATVLSIAHVQSLTRESKSSAPGEKPKFLGILEQRITHIVIFVLVGLSVFMTPMLKFIPMPVLYGIFLYMGISSLNGLQFIDRILLFITPKKYYPDNHYVKAVPLSQVHKFTIIQLLCMVGLFVINEIRQTSIAVPILLVVMIGIRKGLDKVFLEKHLIKLDDVLPAFRKRTQLDDAEGAKNCVTKPMNNGNGLAVLDNAATTDNKECNDQNIKTYNRVKHKGPINITEEMNRTSIWTSLVGEPVSHDSSNGVMPYKRASVNSSKSRKKWQGVQTLAFNTMDDFDNNDEDDGIRLKRIS